MFCGSFFDDGTFVVFFGGRGGLGGRSGVWVETFLNGLGSLLNKERLQGEEWFDDISFNDFISGAHGVGDRGAYCLFGSWIFELCLGFHFKRFHFPRFFETRVFFLQFYDRDSSKGNILLKFWKAYFIIPMNFWISLPSIFSSLCLSFIDDSASIACDVLTVGFAGGVMVSASGCELDRSKGEFQFVSLISLTRKCAWWRYKSVFSSSYGLNSTFYIWKKYCSSEKNS